MSSLGGSCSSGNRSRSRRTVSIVSSTDSVVWDSQTTFSGSRTSTLATSSGPSTRVMCSGASPAVPTTSSWPSWPMSRMSKSASANRTRLAVHLGHQRAGRVDGLEAAGPRLVVDDRRDTVGAEDHRGALGHLVGLVDEDRAALPQGRDDVLVVHDLLAHVDRRTVELEGLLDRDDGPVDAGAVAPRRGQEDPLGGGRGEAGHASMLRGRDREPGLDYCGAALHAYPKFFMFRSLCGRL